MSSPSRKIRRSVHLWPSGNWLAPSYVSRLTGRKKRRSVHLWPSGNWLAPSSVSVRVSVIRAVPLHGPAIGNPSPLSSAAGKVVLELNVLAPKPINRSNVFFRGVRCSTARNRLEPRDGQTISRGSVFEKCKKSVSLFYLIEYVLRIAF